MRGHNASLSKAPKEGRGSTEGSFEQDVPSKAYENILITVLLISIMRLVDWTFKPNGRPNEETIKMPFNLHKLLP